MATLSELITNIKGKMLPLTGGTLTGALTAPSVSITNDNAKVNGKDIVRSVNGTVAGTDGNVAITIPKAYTHPSTHPASMITGLAKVATSGSYNDLSNKPSIPKTPKAYVTQTWRSGNNGYRKWSDGYIEQWGWSGTGKTVSLHTAFKGTNYGVTGTRSSTAGSEVSLVFTSRTTTSFYANSVWVGSEYSYTECFWYAYGY